MRILLAPMEGLLDFVLRDLLTRAGGIDLCVAEFVRVSGTLLPDRVFLRVVPELGNGGRTPAGVPVRAQLMGSDPNCLAENAAKLAALGPEGIDLNFGCPAKTVNRHRGGAVLLDEPELLGTLVAAVRRAVPRHLPVSAKMRLGVTDDRRAVDCAQAIAGAGAREIVVHARTRADGYRPPAWWERVADIRAAVPVPVIANGEIWSADDAARCRVVTGCDALMLGRGIVSDPGLAVAIARSGQFVTPWSMVAPLLAEYWRIVQASISPRAQTGRLKQWLNYLRRRFPEAERAFAAVRLLDDPAQVDPYWFAADRSAARDFLDYRDGQAVGTAQHIP
jgi:tRNA-dihydrouridine synthase C